MLKQELPESSEYEADKAVLRKENNTKRISIAIDQKPLAQGSTLLQTALITVHLKNVSL